MYLLTTLRKLMAKNRKMTIRIMLRHWRTIEAKL